MAKFIQLNDANATRVNLDRVVGYTVTTTSSSEAVNFKLNTNNSGSLVDFVVSYTGDTANEQVLVDRAFLDLVSKANEAPVSADQDA